MSDEALLLLEAELGDSALFDEGVEAVRNACAAGASIAVGAITAAAYYDNPMTGLGALRALMSRLHGVPIELTAWQQVLARRRHPETDDADFTPGFGFVTDQQAERVLVACARLAADGVRSRCHLVAQHHRRIADVAGPLNGTGLAALVFLDGNVDLERAERHWLVCKLEVALTEAQKARRAGVTAFPFSTEGYVYEGPRPAPWPLDLRALMRQVGLESR